ncbi:MAG: transposase [Dehalococcoidia bacterium]
MIHHRRSIRIPGYDYAVAGYYYVTMCTAERELTLEFANVRDAVYEVWNGLPKRFPGLDIDEFVVMPNHVHGIIILQPDARRLVALADVMRAFKSISAIAGNRVLGRSGRPFWQRNLYERDIRRDRELDAVREYIRSNPLNWDVDPENPARRRTA